jgi:HSP20 family protein
MPNDLIRLMHALFLPAAETYHTADWQPALDVYQTRTGWLLKFDLAGVRPDDIVLAVSGNRLHVQGTRKDWCAEQGCAHYQMEITYSHFDRVVELPCDLERARIVTDYQYGLLLVRIETEEAAT